MAQSFFKNLVSVDWLSMMLRAFRLDFFTEPDDGFVWKQRPYGSKQFKSIYDVQFIDEDAVLQPFATFACNPTLESWDPFSCQMKIANNVFYCDANAPWQDVLAMFLKRYCLTVVSICRCDLACDFLFLRNRVSGPMLVDKLKTFAWWKCGSVKCCEYYKMPYKIKVPGDSENSNSDVEMFLHDGQLKAGTESLTFGTMSSDAQVCIYDKTLELKRTEVELVIDGQPVNVSAKEYIRDAHKAAGVWHEHRHTWRVEIRLRNKALMIADSQSGQERALSLEDLQPSNLVYLYCLAADRYFKLVDFSEGGSKPVTAERVSALAAHKDRLPVVDLFRPKTMVLALVKKKYHKNPTRFTKAVITSLEVHADELDQELNEPWKKTMVPADAKVLREASLVLKRIYAGQYANLINDRRDLYECNFLDLVQIFNEGFYVPERAVNLLYSYIFSNRYVSIDFVRKVVQERRLSLFTQWIKCNCNIITYYDMMKIPHALDNWVPPIIAPIYQRNMSNIINFLLDE